MLLMIGLFLSVHFLIQLIEETLGGAAIVPGQAQRERKLERSGCGLIEMAQAILNGGPGIFQHFVIAAAQQDDEFIAAIRMATASSGREAERILPISRMARSPIEWP